MEKKKNLKSKQKKRVRERELIPQLGLAREVASKPLQFSAQPRM